MEMRGETVLVAASGSKQSWREALHNKVLAVELARLHFGRQQVASAAIAFYKNLESRDFHFLGEFPQWSMSSSAR